MVSSANHTFYVIITLTMGSLNDQNMIKVVDLLDYLVTLYLDDDLVVLLLTYCTSCKSVSISCNFQKLFQNQSLGSTPFISHICKAQ